MTELTSPKTAPAFDTVGVDGRRHTLDDYAEADVLVLIQSCNHCPYVQAWEDRINDIAREYATRGVSVVAISSNDVEKSPGDSLPEMEQRARDRGFVFDYLYDDDQSVARALGSSRTPEVFVYDRERNLVYHGAIDDDRDGDNITRHFLRDALDAVLEDREPDPAETPFVGCTVKWRD